MAPAKKTSGKKTDLDLPVSYKTIFWVVVLLTFSSLAASVFLATVPQQTDTLKEVVATCNSTWKMGFGGVLGLLAGKRLPYGNSFTPRIIIAAAPSFVFDPVGLSDLSIRARVFP